MFGRKSKGRTAAPEALEASDAPETQESSGAVEPQPSSGPATGPFDAADVEPDDGRVDLGGLRLQVVAGMELRLEVDQSKDAVNAVQVTRDQATVQLQAFAAPRSSGIWDEIRSELVTAIEAGKGTAEEELGPFGTELRARLPQAGPEGRTVFAPAVFVGVDGPRWMLRAVYSGQAAVDPAARAALDEVLAQVVVVRGSEPMAPRELLPLRMPRQDAV